MPSAAAMITDPERSVSVTTAGGGTSCEGVEAIAEERRSQRDLAIKTMRSLHLMFDVHGHGAARSRNKKTRPSVATAVQKDCSPLQPRNVPSAPNDATAGFTSV
jgi:hypothetical protein